MIDGRGRARITDFGLAGRAGERRGRGRASGTPAYMAPEQLAGKGASRSGATSTRSASCSTSSSPGASAFDGRSARRAASASTRRAAARRRRRSSPGPRSRVERVILRCLEKEPTARPASALRGGRGAAAAAIRWRRRSPPARRPRPRWSRRRASEGALAPAQRLGAVGSRSSRQRPRRRCLSTPVATDQGAGPCPKSPGGARRPRARARSTLGLRRAGRRHRQLVVDREDYFGATAETDPFARTRWDRLATADPPVVRSGTGRARARCSGPRATAASGGATPRRTSRAWRA